MHSSYAKSVKVNWNNVRLSYDSLSVFFRGHFICCSPPETTRMSLCSFRVESRWFLEIYLFFPPGHAKKNLCTLEGLTKPDKGSRPYSFFNEKRQVGRWILVVLFWPYVEQSGPLSKYNALPWIEGTWKIPKKMKLSHLITLRILENKSWFNRDRLCKSAHVHACAVTELSA